MTRGEQATYSSRSRSRRSIRGADAARPRRLRRRARANRDAACASGPKAVPANYGHLHLLVEAEVLAHRGANGSNPPTSTTVRFALAREHGFVNIEALAAEVAARFWFADGKPDFGRVYLEKALHAYDIWGAHRQSRGPARRVRGQHGGPHAGIRDGRLDDGRHRGAQRRARPRDGAQGEPGDLRRDRARAAARDAARHHRRERRRRVGRAAARERRRVPDARREDRGREGARADGRAVAPVGRRARKAS